MADIFQQRSLNGLGSFTSDQKEKCYNGMESEAAKRTEVFWAWLNSAPDRSEGVPYMLRMGEGKGSFREVFYRQILDSPFFNPGWKGSKARPADGIAFIMSKNGPSPWKATHLFVVATRPFMAGTSRDFWLVRIRLPVSGPDVQVTLWKQPFD